MLRKCRRLANGRRVGTAGASRGTRHVMRVWSVYIGQSTQSVTKQIGSVFMCRSGAFASNGRLVSSPDYIMSVSSIAFKGTPQWT